MELAPSPLDSELNAMKITLFVLFIFCTAGAFGQAVLSNQPQVMQSPSHPLHAAVHAMATESPLVGGEGYTYAQGERPLWEFGPVSQPTPLGDVARAYRKEKLAARKAEIVFEKQGS